MSLDEEIKKLQVRIHNDNKERGWWEEEPHTAQVLINIISESIEAWKEYVHNHAWDEIYFEIDDNGNEKPEGIPIEMADSFIRILDACEAKGIDLISAVRLKLDYNKTRGYRHGGRKA